MMMKNKLIVKSNRFDIETNKLMPLLREVWATTGEDAKKYYHYGRPKNPKHGWLKEI